MTAAAVLAVALLASPARSAPGPRILLLGDSHTAQTFGSELDSKLRGLPGAAVETCALASASPGWWFTGHKGTKGFFFRYEDGTAKRGPQALTPLFADLQAGFQPTVVVVALGANLYGDDAFAEKDSRRLAEAVAASGARCLWLGPPRGRNKPNLDALYSALKRGTAGNCSFIDSRYPFLVYPDQGGDGAHWDRLGEPGKELARRWAEAVFTEIDALLKAPAGPRTAAPESRSPRLAAGPRPGARALRLPDPRLSPTLSVLRLGGGDPFSVESLLVR